MALELVSGYSSTSSSIFAPFPNQILPLLVFWEQLSLAGFELIADEKMISLAISGHAYKESERPELPKKR